MERNGLLCVITKLILLNLKFKISYFFIHCERYERVVNKTFVHVILFNAIFFYF